jgi:hypothetical protein
MVFGLALQVTHLGLRNTSILLSDISDGVDFVNSFRKPGPVYVPANQTVTLIYSTTVAMSFEVGALRTFINQGELSASFVTGPAWGGVTSGVLVYRPGEPNPGGNVFATWAGVYAASSAIQGQHVIQIDDTLVSPATVPAGTYDLYDVILAGSLSKFNATGTLAVLEFEDGASVTNLTQITDFLDVVSASTSPVLSAPTTPGFHGLVIRTGVELSSNTGVPFIDIPAGSVFIVAMDLASTLSTDALSISGGAGAVYAGEATTVLGDAIVGASGLMIFVIEKFTLGVETAQAGFAGTITGLLTLQPQSNLLFSAGTIVAPGASYLYPGGTNPAGASPASLVPQGIPITSDGYIGVCRVWHQTPAAPNPITYDVLVNGIPVRSISSDASFSTSSTTSGNIIRVYSGDVIDVAATTAGAITPTDIRFVVGIV